MNVQKYIEAGCTEHSGMRTFFPRRISSAGWFGLHTFKVIKGFVHWYLTLRERDGDRISAGTCCAAWM